MTSPALTTTHAPGEQMGRSAARALIALLNGRLEPAGYHQLVTCKVIAGESLGPAPGAPGAP